MSEAFKYFAFISYSSHDIEWGKRLQKRLEHYRLPATLCSEHNLPRNPIKPVFFAPTDIQPGGLTEELQERLRSSRHLIVICSPHSAKSEWVSKEIEFFHSLGRTKDIHFFIVEGAPHSGDPETECFNPIIEKLGLPEILGANINEKIYRQPWLNRERAYVQLISKLLSVEFDTIWQRHKRQLVTKIAAYTAATMLVVVSLFSVWLNSRPVDVEISLNEASMHNENLPPLQNAVITMILDNEIKTDTIRTIDSPVVFTNIPHRFLKKQAAFTVSCRDFLKVDTVLNLSKNVVLDINRNPKVYGDVHFFVWNPKIEEFVANAVIKIDGVEAVSNEEGYVSVFMPLESQKQEYQLNAAFQLSTPTIVMPCGESDIISIQ